MRNKIKHSALVLAMALPVSLPVTGYCDATSTNYSESAISNAPDSAFRDADNTGKNKRDRRDGTLTPGDQGTTKQDMEITRNIRKAVVSETNSLSIYAKNIKIITVNGKVTLRGPVKNDSERSRLNEIATTAAGAGNVNDQLEVKTNP